MPKFKEKVHPFEARQFKGGIEAATEMVSWLKTLFGERIQVYYTPAYVRELSQGTDDSEVVTRSYGDFITIPQSMDRVEDIVLYPEDWIMINGPHAQNVNQVVRYSRGEFDHYFEEVTDDDEA